jgi:hypothetical protein
MGLRHSTVRAGCDTRRRRRPATLSSGFAGFTAELFSGWTRFGPVSSGRPAPQKFRTTIADLGVPAVKLDRALQLAAELADEELRRKRRRA